MSENKDKAYAVDEHFYKSPEWFLENVNRYDDYDRSLPKVFAGEYCSSKSRITFIPSRTKALSSTTITLIILILFSLFYSNCLILWEESY